VTLVFIFRRKMNVHFRFRFVFGRKWNLIFVCIYVYGQKWKMLFCRPLVYITKRLVLRLVGLVLRCKILVLVLNTRLGLGLSLEIKVLVLILVLITSLNICQSYGRESSVLLFLWFTRYIVLKRLIPCSCIFANSLHNHSYILKSYNILCCWNSSGLYFLHMEWKNSRVSLSVDICWYVKWYKCLTV